MSEDQIISYLPSTTITTSAQQVCKCCDGRGWQANNDGIKIICPACNGTGLWPMQAQPFYQPIWIGPVPYAPPWLPQIWC